MVLGIKQGRYFYGRLMMSRIAADEGSVAVPQLHQPLLVKGPKSLNRAINADMVCLEVLPESEWEPVDESSNIDAAHLL